ncbi:hypothetical protein JTE90_000762 [Oedothorax gibbosus]|uniref:Uncharacterized protein n=1 Tax=Oedothorax gibbosus TaxID=931172 RepID=A0AAV6UNH0_9ARAC|nr:hypothetical protein JTE90_000762 [Oedothorax gibbosus]
MGNNPSTNSSSAVTGRQQRSETENKWLSGFSRSKAQEVQSYQRRVTEDVYDHMDHPEPKRLSTSPEIDIHEVIHQGATRMFQGISTEGQDPAERPYNQHHVPTWSDEKKHRTRN